MTGQVDRIWKLKGMCAEGPHGTRARYTTGCHCGLCRRANTEYQRGRERAIARGEGNPLVDAAPARAHMLELSRQGVGKRSVQAATDLNMVNLYWIRSGVRTRIRKRTLERILAVDAGARGGRSLVDAEPSWVLLRKLLRGGYTKLQLARWLGSKAKVPSIQLRRDKITAESAMRVERMYRSEERRVGKECRSRWSPYH